MAAEIDLTGGICASDVSTGGICSDYVGVDSSVKNIHFFIATGTRPGNGWHR